LNHLSTIPIVFLLGLSPLLLQQQPIQHWQHLQPLCVDFLDMDKRRIFIKKKTW
jgi:hypothetical protein